MIAPGDSPSLRTRAFTSLVALGLALTLPLFGQTTAQAAATSPGTLPRSLEGLGQPTEDYSAKNFNPLCYGYKTAGAAHMVMAGTTYHRGFQLSTSSVCGSTWTWAWHLAGRYRSFTVSVGLDATDTRPATLAFKALTGRPITFRADGHLVSSTVLISGLPTTVTMNATGLLSLVIQTTTGGATIDFGADTLTP